MFTDCELPTREVLEAYGEVGLLSVCLFVFKFRDLVCSLSCGNILVCFSFVVQGRV